MSKIELLGESAILGFIVQNNSFLYWPAVETNYNRTLAGEYELELCITFQDGTDYNV